MYRLLLGLALLGSFAFGPAASAFQVTAACVGGPRVPSYAFSNWMAANQCRQRIASQSRACRDAVRTGTCRTQNWQVNRIPAFNCICNPGHGAIGFWN